MSSSKRRRLSPTSPPDLTAFFSLAANSLSHDPHRRSNSRSSASASNSDTDSDDDSSSDSSASSKASSSSSDSSDASGDDKHGWKKRRRRHRAARRRQRLEVILGVAIFLLVVGAAGAYAYRHLSSDETSPVSDVPSESSGSSSKASSGGGKASSSGKATSSGGSTTAAASPPKNSVKPTEDSGWFPVDKVRGVNLGSLFIFEPWMAPTSWEKLGCKDYNSEWPCIEALGLDTLQSKFEDHWSSFYGESDFTDMASMGINTVRIPLGYWTVDSLIKEGEYFPRNSMPYVKKVLAWAKAAGIWVILDHHGAPGSQTKGESFTGHDVDTAGFFTKDNYQRAYDLLTNWTTMAHTDDDFSTVVAIQVVNEPLQDSSTDMTSVFYPAAQKAIRDAEDKLGISCDGDDAKCLNIQFMDKSWGSGDPTDKIDTSDRLTYDDHNYAQWIVSDSDQTRDGYLKYLCTNTRSTDMAPVVVGEWSLSTIGGGELDPSSDGAKEFFQKFAAAQILAAEKSAGQVFWSWKTEINSPNWGYRDAVEAGWIPKDLSTLDKTVCDPYK